ncbi:LPD7 domain-containing protein [Variovorax ginsengisoli]|uniref:Uncharacterized protein (DUF2267 family) n=1 Tax=Variovorax ginsengisoli TaxID=363844 RepID=A0ABT9SGC7_9BURK|nr:LPD7 domain-containing protein [Variovorax ginsengisoli]MDP9902422.1 uncharacterized protein (DUF2267 family) [Variovorax ginsengisoli]
MLVRVNAAAGGIKEYLETGRKKGREHDRELIDERLPLAGDIELLDDVIQSIQTKQEGDSRYLHITLGFSEQFTSAPECGPGQINAELLHEVVDAYRQALMAAYDPSEYLFYAEAHIPKVTHELNASTGDYESRLPHVHIVIPMRNLESDRYLNPFGHGEQTMWAAQAIQEDINRRFGLKSPLASRRDPAAPQHPLGRHVASFEGQSPKQIRAYLADLVAQGHVDSFEQLVEAASVIGVTTVRDGKDGAYLNVKPDWADRGINLKDLGRSDFDATARSLRQGVATPDFQQLATQWKEQGAFEVRYAHGSPRMRAAYKAMSPAERVAFLNQAREATQARLEAYDVPIERQHVDAAAQAIQRAMRQVEKEGVPTPRSVGLAERINSLIKEVKNGRPERVVGDDGNVDRAKSPDGSRVREDSGRDGKAVRRRSGRDAEEVARPAGRQLSADQGASRNLSDAELKSSTDPQLLLDAARKRFGIDPVDYFIRTGSDGAPRIVHNDKQYNLGDFFTKHLQRPWAEAREILVECHARTVALNTDTHETTIPGGDRTGDRSSQSLLSRSAAAIARGQQVAEDADKVARYLQRRSLGATLEATLRGLREDRPSNEAPLTPADRIERAREAISRATDRDIDPEAVRAALSRRTLGQAVSVALNSLTLDRPPNLSKTDITLSRSAQAIARGQQIADDADKVARFLQRRDLGAALEATLRELRENRPSNEAPLTPADRIERAREAISRATDRDIDPEAVRAVLSRRTLGQAVSLALHSLTLDRPERRKSQTVIEAIAASAKPRQLHPDRLKTDTNPAIVLTAAKKLYGIDLADYSVGTGSDGAPRIIHKHKQYNLGDFLTKHLQRPWAEAQTVLRDCYHASISDALPPPDKVLWRQFSQWRERQFETVAARRSADGAAFRSRVLDAREEYKRRKAEAQPLPGRERAAAVARARADQFVAQQVIAVDRAKASAAARIPRRNAHYREFLVELASDGDTAALGELRRMAPHQPEPDAKISGARSQPVFPLPTYSVDAKGAVTYWAGESAIVRDSTQGVTVLKAQIAAYDAAIRVAIARYGRTLTLNGDARFVASMSDAARRTGLELVLRDASRPKASPVLINSRER